MKLTIQLSLVMMLSLFGIIWAGAAFHPFPKLMRFMPDDIEEAVKDHKPPFPAAPVLGKIIITVLALIFSGAYVYGGYDSIDNNFSFLKTFGRFIIMLYSVKVFDIICLDFLLITKSHFFQHYFPETEGCAGYNNFGFNRKEQLGQIIRVPFIALASSGICMLFLC